MLKFQIRIFLSVYNINMASEDLCICHMNYFNGGDWCFCFFYDEELCKDYSKYLISCPLEIMQRESEYTDIDIIFTFGWTICMF